MVDGDPFARRAMTWVETRERTDSPEVLCPVHPSQTTSSLVEEYAKCMLVACAKSCKDYSKSSSKCLVSTYATFHTNES
jgi:hypothetical protein